MQHIYIIKTPLLDIKREKTNKNECARCCSAKLENSACFKKVDEEFKKKLSKSVTIVTWHR